MKKSTIVVALCIFLLAACQVAKDADQASSVRGGRCALTKNGVGTVLCYDFNEGYDANTGSAECDTFYNTTYISAPGVNGKDFLSGDGNACDSSSNVGTCTKSSGVMYYYNNQWSAVNAQTDCTGTLGGTWNP
jgi:hypothetical protein